MIACGRRVRVVTAYVSAVGTVQRCKIAASNGSSRAARTFVWVRFDDGSTGCYRAVDLVREHSNDPVLF